MQKNVKLKSKIFELGLTSKAVAQKAKIPMAYLSMATNGRYILNENQKKRVAEVLNMEPEDLFNQ